MATAEELLVVKSIGLQAEKSIMAGKKGKEVARNQSLGGETHSMRTRSADKKKNARFDGASASTATDGANTSLDKDLWGTLQHHICLAECVYSKLPFEEFFNLRTVCKDWYNIACKRLALKERIHKPFFTLFTKGIFGHLDGILSYNARFSGWEWRLSMAQFADSACQFAATGGVVYYSHGGREGDISAGEFDWEFRLYRKLPAPPILQNGKDKTILGIMRVESERGSFHNHVLVCASQGFDTQVYDSRTNEWQTKPCRPKPETRGEIQASTGCAYCNGRMYITTEHKREIFVYDFGRASWSSLKSPCKWISKQRQHYCLDTLGAWNGRVFDVAEDSKPGSYVQGSLCVWELVDETTDEWEVYDRLPKDLYTWLRCNEGFCPPSRKVADVTVQASFCGDYMLVYSWDFISRAAGRFCLFNMGTKNWQKLEVPAGRVAIHDFSGTDDSDDDSSLGDSDDDSSLVDSDMRFFGRESSLDMYDSDPDSDYHLFF
ncbi:hypothetical protein KC19_8G033200 [Ceratodon purpureus]|uniref:F-box domain-containing protein n=1 Tax=Ceratodon purpureus TaxID=3225 RepID=A0A8T0H090_CERPU|nr:hypothetical protein KC19_8G033200 [Ceratodon purpureus]